MIKLNRTTEYGLIALKHLRRKCVADPSYLVSAREISETYGLPFEITAKTLQRLRDTGLIQSLPGSKGGYTLGKPLESVNVAEFLEWMEGPQGLVPCGESPCEYHGKCEIKDVMGGLNLRLKEFLSSIKLNEIAEAHS